MKIELGTDVRCNGFVGYVREICTGQLAGMVVVRLPGGDVCVSLADVTVL